MPLSVGSLQSDRNLERPDLVGVGVGRSFEQSLQKADTRPIRTPLSMTQASAALRDAWTQVTGEPADEKTVALLTAQWAHETAHGASMYNYNFGGIKGSGPTGLSVEQRTTEGWGRTARHITDRFRAYESAEAGAHDYVQLLVHRYPEAIHAAKIGDSDGFVRGLKQRGYFTGDAQAYARSVSSVSASILERGARDSSSANESRPRVLAANGTVRSPNTNETLSAAPYGAMRPNHSSPPRIDPLLPTALISGLLDSPSVIDGHELAAQSNPIPIEGVSSLLMVDEVLRASLYQVGTDSDAPKHAPASAGA